MTYKCSFAEKWLKRMELPFTSSPGKSWPCYRRDWGSGRTFSTKNFQERPRLCGQFWTTTPRAHSRSSRLGLRSTRTARFSRFCSKGMWAGSKCWITDLRPGCRFPPSLMPSSSTLAIVCRQVIFLVKNYVALLNWRKSWQLIVQQIDVFMGHNLVAMSHGWFCTRYN